MSAADVPLEVKGLFKRFGGLIAVKDVSFSIQAGEILGLIGPNGSGKSTVMKSIIGVERPDGGSVRINGVEVAGWPPHRIARLGVGMVFQHSRPLHRQTVLENIVLGLLPDKLLDFFPDAAIEKRARAIAERVGLGAALDRRPSTLPFADLRRMEIAKAIARDPQSGAGRRALRRPDGARNGRFREADRRNARRRPRGADRRPQRQERLRARRSHLRHVRGRAHRRRLRAGGHAERNRAPGLSRRRLETAARPESAFRDAQTPFLEVEKLNVFYGKAQALENVSIHVHQGEFVAIVGLNGAGKTTLFNAISGLVPYAGEIRRQGRPCVAKRRPRSPRAASCNRRKGASSSPR